MKRVTLLADRIKSEGTGHRIYLTGNKGCLYIHGRHVLSVEDADARDFAPPAPPTAGSVLTSAELDALPVGSVVDATVTGVRVRAIRRRGWGSWGIMEHLEGSWATMSRDLKDAVLVTDGPIQPAPVKPLPLPMELGARFWGRTPDSEPTWWFVHNVGGLVGRQCRYVSSTGRGVPSQGVATHGLVRLPEPDASDVTA